MFTAIAPLLLALLTAAGNAGVGATTAPVPPGEKCERGLNFPGGDLPNMPIRTPDGAACRARCTADPECNLFTWHAGGGCSYHGETCAFVSASGGGCCYLKAEEVNGVAPTVNNCTCSGWVKVPGTRGTTTTTTTTTTNTRSTKNILYLLVDDLRPELEPYSDGKQRVLHSPNIQKLADSGTVFDNAYCQISVCSPSRMSFLTSKRPDHSGIYNFIDHFRQADCGLNAGGQRWVPSAQLRQTAAVHLTGKACGEGVERPCGASGTCCSLCSERAQSCDRWSFDSANGTCLLYQDNVVRRDDVPAAATTVADPNCVSGVVGTFDTHAKWWSMPQWFKQHGYLTLSSGKIFHTEEGGEALADPTLNGPGMPPNEDPPSWTPGLSMELVNAVAPMVGCPSISRLCTVDAPRDGIVTHPHTDAQLCDRVVADDAVAKLRLASNQWHATRRPFFLAAGFRKPHLAFRFPKPFLDDFPELDQIDVAVHQTLDPSQPLWAHKDVPPQATPFTPPDVDTARRWRLYYRAAVAWVDTQIGRVLDELDVLGLANDTMVVLHADHGWSLGEHGEWQKFSNFEHGTRVPLIVRVPDVEQVARTSVLAELIDVWPTMAEAVGVPLEGADAARVDGVSLLPALRRAASAAINVSTAGSRLKMFALSQYMRCPQDPAVPWKANACLFVDRSQLPVMGYTIRTAEWRYTEWVAWNGSSLRPDWGRSFGNELYTHVGDDGLDFDRFENRNQNETEPVVARQMRGLLQQVVANQTRLWPAP